MKPYSNKPQRLDPARCLYAQIRADKKAAKSAERQRANRLIDHE